MRSSACFISPFPIFHPFYQDQNLLITRGEVLLQGMRHAHVLSEMMYLYNHPNMLQEVLETELGEVILSYLDYLVLYLNNRSFGVLDEAIRTREVFSKRFKIHYKIRCVVVSNDVSGIPAGKLRARFGNWKEQKEPAIFISPDVMAAKCFCRLIGSYLNQGTFTIDQAVLCAS